LALAALALAALALAAWALAALALMVFGAYDSYPFFFFISLLFFLLI